MTIEILKCHNTVMTEPLLQTLLSRRYTLRPFLGVERAWQFATKTPEGTTLNIARWGSAGDHLALWPCREGFDPALATRMMNHVGDVSADFFDEKPIRCLRGFRTPGRGFTQIVLLGPEAHTQFEKTSEDLQAQTVVCFPAYDCEFTGDEEPSMMRTLRKYFVATADWGREPQPRVWTMHRNAVTGSRSPGQKRGLGRFDKIMKELETLPADSQSFVEVENIHGTVARWTKSSEAYALEFSESSRAASHASFETLQQTLRAFLMEPGPPDL